VFREQHRRLVFLRQSHGPALIGVCTVDGYLSLLRDTIHPLSISTAPRILSYSSVSVIKSLKREAWGHHFIVTNQNAVPLKSNIEGCAHYVGYLAKLRRFLTVVQGAWLRSKIDMLASRTTRKVVDNLYVINAGGGGVRSFIVLNQHSVPLKPTFRALRAKFM